MEPRDLLYVLFWSFAIAFALFFMGFGDKVVFLFSLSLVGTVFVEKMESAPHAIGALFLAVAFSVYFGKNLVFTSQLFVASLLFLLLPFVLMEVRKRMRK